MEDESDFRYIIMYQNITITNNKALYDALQCNYSFYKACMLACITIIYIYASQLFMGMVSDSIGKLKHAVCCHLSLSPGVLLPPSDVDECSELQGRCEHVCTNTQGSFRCSCRLGYELHIDGHRCVGQWLPSTPRPDALVQLFVPTLRPPVEYLTGAGQHFK